jgi:MFS family permease
VTNFKQTYGVWEETKQAYAFPSIWLSAGSGTANAGMAIGCIIAGPIIERLGRRLTIVVIVIIGLIGMIIQNAVPSYWGIMAGRTVNAVSMVGVSSSVLHNH